MNNKGKLRCFVTVGSTQFDALFHMVTSSDIIKLLKSHGFSNMVLQCGNGKSEELDAKLLLKDGESVDFNKDGLEVSIWHI